MTEIFSSDQWITALYFIVRHTKEKAHAHKVLWKDDKLTERNRGKKSHFLLVTFIPPPPSS